MSKVFSDNDGSNGLSMLERILPWTCTGHNATSVNKPDGLSRMTVEKKSEYKRSAHSAVAEKEIKTRPDAAEKIKPLISAKTPASFESAISENPNTPMLEMWNVIESVGIRRDNLDRIFRTDEAAVSELYSLVEKRLHYQREQDMIKRLKAHVEKLVKSKTDTQITP